MSADIRRVGGTGVHTVEGIVAGDWAVTLTKERDKQRAEYEAQKEQIKKANASDFSRIDSKFSVASDVAESEFRKRTVGLVTAEEFRRAREEGAQLSQQQDIADAEALKRSAEQENERIAKEREQKRKRTAATLSFAVEEEEEEEEEVPRTKARILKDPSVDTSFLPDPDRERELLARREGLKAEWLQQQEAARKELLEVVFSYWDGSGHRQQMTVSKGMTIGKFLEAAKLQLMGEFHGLRSVSAEDLLYVKEDLMIPQHLSFYDLIVTKARGKSGPLFHFDVHEDVRLLSDARIEKDESHPGKVVERRWYERNKHIFPASRWEAYDPLRPVAATQTYTIRG